MLSGPGVVFFVSLTTERSSSSEKAWLSHGSDGIACNSQWRSQAKVWGGAKNLGGAKCLILGE